MPSSPSPECPICGKELQSVEHRLDPNMMDKGYIKTLTCPTKVLVHIMDIVKQKHHYTASSQNPWTELIYPPYLIVIDPIGDKITDIWMYQENEKPKLILTLDIVLDLPWDNEDEVRATLNLLNTFA